jgi:hypothetical protein
MVARRATLEDSDVDSIVHHRRAMFWDMGYRDEHALDGMSVRFRPWLRRKMEAGDYLAWFALGPDSSIAAGLRMLPAFRQQLLSRFFPYPHQEVELLIGLLSPAAHTAFPQFFQPTGAMARGIDLLTGAGNRPAPIYRLETVHHAREIFAGGEIAATQFPPLQRGFNSHYAGDFLLHTD